MRPPYPYSQGSLLTPRRGRRAAPPRPTQQGRQSGNRDPGRATDLSELHNTVWASELSPLSLTTPPSCPHRALLSLAKVMLYYGRVCVPFAVPPDAPPFAQPACGAVSTCLPLVTNLWYLCRRVCFAPPSSSHVRFLTNPITVADFKTVRVTTCAKGSHNSLIIETVTVTRSQRARPELSNSEFLI